MPRQTWKDLADVGWDGVDCRQSGRMLLSSATDWLVANGAPEPCRGSISVLDCMATFLFALGPYAYSFGLSASTGAGLA